MVSNLFGNHFAGSVKKEPPDFCVTIDKMFFEDVRLTGLDFLYQVI